MAKQSTFNVLASTDEMTVVSEYIPSKSTSSAYQSEAELEKEFISLLTRQGYTYLPIHTESDLIDNLRHQLEELNHYMFSDFEWKQFFTTVLANPNDGIVEKTRMIQQDNVQILKRDDGTTKNITLIDRKNIHQNRLQVINQYINNDGKHDNRYDVTILVNGFPMVHCELKRRGIAIREAFNQIDRYQRDSFWASSGLYEYIQIFVISNGTHTKYYSNTTRENKIKEACRKGSSKRTSNSFEFTSYWADGKNRVIPDLIDFTKTFLAKHTILNIITRFCVFTSENLLLVMRPYQITATERILTKINIATNYHYDGSINAGGFIWHTTGSGKTLTSFKTAQLAADLPFIDKVLFVVDRKDLDYQTMKEYDRFEKGAADGNTSTKVLEYQLSDKDKSGKPHEYRIIITTIQKLANFVSKNKGHKVANQKIVIIFDECHRSQFGDMHKKITKFFKHYYLFGFTGTPIFAENAMNRNSPNFSTTPQLFGGVPNPKKNNEKTLPLHTYTIVDAINDENVLPFRIDYVDTMHMKKKADKKVFGIDRESALASPERITEVVSYVLEHFDQKTKRGTFYNLKGKRANGFNSIFAAQSVSMAIQYYKEFKKQIEEKNLGLTIATIYSFSANEEADILDEDFDVEEMDATSRDALESAIMDYNQKFHTNFDTSSAKFQNYYKDLSQRVKNREVDILIVVNMFLTGFDATTLNTLWVDKNLKMHGLIQAFSRTNRILNSVKAYGNIVCFRNLEEQVEEAIALFGDSEANSIVLLKDYDSYYEGYEEDSGKYHPGYRDIVEKLEEKFPIGTPIVGEENQKDFIGLFGSLLRVMNILSAFDKFETQHLLSDRDMQDYQSEYIDLYDKFRRKRAVDMEDISDDIVFEMELVKQVEVNIDYILAMVKKYHSGNCLDKEAQASILKAVDSSLQLRSKKGLIKAFLSNINMNTDVDHDWDAFVQKQKKEDLEKIIKEEKLKAEATKRLLDESFASGQLKTSGTSVDEIMPPMSRFDGSRAEKKQRIIEKLKGFFDKYFGLGKD